MRSAKALQQLKGKEEEKLRAALLLALVVKKKRSAAALFCFGSSDEVSPHDSAGHWTITGPSSDEQPTSTSWLVRSQRYSMFKSLPVWWRQRLQAPLLGGASKASFSRPSRAAHVGGWQPTRTFARTFISCLSHFDGEISWDSWRVFIWAVSPTQTGLLVTRWETHQILKSIIGAAVVLSH